MEIDLGTQNATKHQGKIFLLSLQVKMVSDRLFQCFGLPRCFSDSKGVKTDMFDSKT